MKVDHNTLDVHRASDAAPMMPFALNRKRRNLQCLQWRPYQIQDQHW